MKTPLLSVCLITYNQADYIRQAIDSVLGQQTDFDWDLVIADDYSTDGTREVLLEYERAHPDKVKLILQKKNVGAEKNWYDLIRYPNSKYIAYLEGDDYWIDQKKLQKQVDFMEDHDDYALCFHPVKITFENTKKGDEIYPNERPDLTVLELLRRNYIQSNSVVYRRRDYSIMPTGIMPGDWYFHLLHAQFGNIGFIDEVMAVYRRHSGGIWWSAHKNDRREFWRRYGEGHLRMYRELLSMFGDTSSYRDAIAANIRDAIIAMSESSRDGRIEVPGVLPESSELVSALVANISKMRKSESEAYESEIKRLNGVIREREDELARLLTSRTWRLRSTVRGIARKVRPKK